MAQAPFKPIPLPFWESCLKEDHDLQLSGSIWRGAQQSRSKCKETSHVVGQDVRDWHSLVSSFVRRALWRCAEINGRSKYIFQHKSNEKTVPRNETPKLWETTHFNDC
eukprot:232936-Amphidinium_carterae.1